MAPSGFVFGILTSKCGSNILLAPGSHCKSYLLQFVRWRKFRGMPKAPSKVFLVKERKANDPEELDFMRIKTAHYNTVFNSIKQHLVGELILNLGAQKASEISESAKLEEREFTRACEINDIFSQDSSKRRKGRLTREREEYEKTHFERTIEHERLKETERNLAKRIVQSEIEKSKSFINLENLDVNLEKLLDSEPKNYNFAINIDGEIIRGGPQVTDPIVSHRLTPSNATKN